MAERQGPPDPSEAFADLARRLAESVPPAFLGPAVLMPFLEWQRALLTAYQRALADPSLPDALEENTRTLARTLMAWYLEVLSSQRALREALMHEQTELITAWGEALDRLRAQLDQAGMARDGADHPEEPPGRRT